MESLSQDLMLETAILHFIPFIQYVLNNHFKTLYPMLKNSSSLALQPRWHTLVGVGFWMSLEKKKRRKRREEGLSGRE